MTSPPGPRWVYGFEDLDDAEHHVGGSWEDVRGLLGGKGANLADMTRLGIPVPPGFTITTEACNAFTDAGGTAPDGLWEEVGAAVRRLEELTGKRFGDPADPLLLSCRSGARFSMPGMMDTVLDIGMNHETVEAMVAAGGDERFALDCHRRLLQMFATVVLGVDDEPFEDELQARRDRRGVVSDSELGAEDLREVIAAFGRIVAQAAEPVPDDPNDQLRRAVEAVFASWSGARARAYREASGIPHDLGTAVNVVTMVFGNRGEDCATGVAMSRNATTGEDRLEGDYLMDAQGEDVVAGTRPTRSIADFAADMPGPAAQLEGIAKQLERHYRDMQDMEFTVENGRLWMLQTRDGKRTAQAAVRIAVEMADEGLIDPSEAVSRVSPEQVELFLHPQFAAGSLPAPLTSGLNVSPGAAVGVVALDPDLAERWSGEGRPVVLVRADTKPSDVHGMLAAQGILTSGGGRTSHAALVARQFGKPAVVGASEVVVDLSARAVTVAGTEIREGDWISIDGTSGCVYAGRVETVAASLDDPWLLRLLEWADGFRRLGVRANADNPDDARRARHYGAEGIGLCRTEHMFLGSDRLPIMQRLIAASDAAERSTAIADLFPMQLADFEGILREMSGAPVVIRLVDPPLHEFLPSYDELSERVADLRVRLAQGDDPQGLEAMEAELAELAALRERVGELREENPMLGLRGVRLGLVVPELIRMQTRAIVQAALTVEAEGLEVRPEIMVPLVGYAGEMAAARSIVEAEMQAAFDAAGRSISVPVGTMIEVPRAALTAGDIAHHADFFSFGTNDLTQMTLGISRDDAEAEFLLSYLAEGILDENPFRSIDAAGVGRLMGIAVAEGRASRGDLEIGICGEHGGDPASIELCHRLGLDYVSCSAFRVPVARLAAARASLASEVASGGAGR